MEYKEHLNMLPVHMREGIAVYIEHGIRPGDFLTAILENNLQEAVGRADHINVERLVDWAQFICWYTPRGCWGDPKSVREWIKGGGLEGQKREKEKATDGTRD